MIPKVNCTAWVQSQHGCDYCRRWHGSLVVGCNFLLDVLVSLAFETGDEENLRAVLKIPVKRNWNDESQLTSIHLKDYDGFNKG